MEVQQTRAILTPKPPAVALVTPQTDASQAPLEDEANSDDTSMRPSVQRIQRNNRIVICIPGGDGPRRATQQRARHTHCTPPPNGTEAETLVPTNLMRGE